jgi:hypothetical protein
MFIYKWSKRLIETLQRIDAKCTEAAEVHGRYCVSDAKIRAGSAPAVQTSFGKTMP